MSKQEYIDRFMAASWLYFRLMDRIVDDIHTVEVEEMLEFINEDGNSILCLDQHPA